ncbi:MAG: bifunctional oligoribonuclease/PAP phosphatase NrnA [Phycisphaerae bacterium]
MSPEYTAARQELLDQLANSQRVLVTTHVRPDGDALGTTAAMILGMRHKGIDAEPLLLSDMPHKYAFVYENAGISHHTLETVDLKRFDCLLVCDTGTWSQLPGLAERAQTWFVPKLVLDHHLTQEAWSDVKLVNTAAAAAGEIAFDVLKHWHVPLDPLIAEALFVAICTDTGWFQYSSTTPMTLRTAAELIEAGVDTDRLQQRLYQSEKAKRIFLQARVLGSLQLHARERVAVVKATRADFEATGAGTPDTEDVVNVPMAIASVQVSLLAAELPEGGPVKLSLRSKGGVNCAEVAQQFEGGGHARAAGCRFAGTLEEAATAVVKVIEKLL